jgi:hypothetical protein
VSGSDQEHAVRLIREGALAHYERDDDDALLRGDQLYAEGLVLLAASGDLDAVARLADGISRVAQKAASDARLDVDDTLRDALN